MKRRKNKRVDGLEEKRRRGFMSREGRGKAENEWVSCAEKVEEKS